MDQQLTGVGWGKKVFIQLCGGELDRFFFQQGIGWVFAGLYVIYDNKEHITTINIKRESKQMVFNEQTNETNFIIVQQMFLFIYPITLW